MNFASMKLIYMFSCIGLGLIILSPTLFAVVSFPENEKISEMWILGSNHMFESGVFNVSKNKLETVFLGVSNYMGDLEYYTVFAKFRNQSEPLPNITGGFPSPLEPIFEYRMFLSNNETLEENFNFSFEEISFEAETARVSKLSINGNDVVVDKTIAWDDEKSGFYCQLFFELWIYNASTSSFQFHNRSVWFWLNLVETL